MNSPENKAFFFGTSPLFRRFAIPKVHCANTRHSANVWVKVRVKVRVRVRIKVSLMLRVSGNSKTFGIADRIFSSA